MSYSADVMKNILLLENEIVKKHGLDSKLWLDVDPLTTGLVLHITVKFNSAVTPQDLHKDVEDVVKSTLGDGVVGTVTSSSSKGRGRKKRGGIDPALSLTMNIMLKGDV